MIKTDTYAIKDLTCTQAATASRNEVNWNINT